MYSSTQAKLVKKTKVREKCNKLIRDKGLQLCIEWRPYNYVVSTIDAEENWRATNREGIQSSILSQCGKTRPYMKRTFTGII